MSPDITPAPPEAEVIRLARESLDMTIATAAKITKTFGGHGVGATYWGDVERGTGGRRGERVRVRASDKALAVMARAVKVAPEQLASAGREGAASILAESLRRGERSRPTLTAIPGNANAGGDVFDLAEKRLLRDIQAKGDPLELMIWDATTMSLDERAVLIEGIRIRRGELNGEREVELLDGRRVPTEEGPAGRAGTV